MNIEGSFFLVIGLRMCPSDVAAVAQWQQAQGACNTPESSLLGGTCGLAVRRKPRPFQREGMLYIASTWGSIWGQCSKCQAWNCQKHYSNPNTYRGIGIVLHSNGIDEPIQFVDSSGPFLTCLLGETRGVDN